MRVANSVKSNSQKTISDIVARGNLSIASKVLRPLLPSICRSIDCDRSLSTLTILNWSQYIIIKTLRPPLSNSSRRYAFILCSVSFTASIYTTEIRAQQHLVPSGEELDLTGYVATLDDNFRTPNIVSRGPFSEHFPGAKWIAHTPWNGDFGDAIFSDPGPAGPFEFGSSGLSIKAVQNPNGTWRSGLICSVDRDGQGQQGFSQKFGYFEIKAKLPAGDGAWPAFWLIGVNKSNGSSEIDVLEYYGQFSAGFHTVIHYWNGPMSKHDGYVVDVEPNSLTDSFHTFGVSIEDKRTVFYLDRRPYLNIETPEFLKQPMYILANLALGGGWPIRNLPSPSTMHIAYIKVFKKK